MAVNRISFARISCARFSYAAFVKLVTLGALVAAAVATPACQRGVRDDGASAASSHTPAAAPAPAPKPRVVRPDPDALPPAPSLPIERRALQVVDGEDRIVDADLARARGLTLVDLSDGWAPRIFADGLAPDGAPLANR